MTTETNETLVHASSSRRACAIVCRRRGLEDLRDRAAYRVTRVPLLAVGVAFVAGVVAIVLSAQCARALRTASASKEW
jgi:hypothetical protein